MAFNIHITPLSNVLESSNNSIVPICVPVKERQFQCIQNKVDLKKYIVLKTKDFLLYEKNLWV